MHFNYLSSSIMQCLVGSHAYGTATEDSDEDVRGVIIPPKEYWYGLREFGQYTRDDGEDVQLYELRRFLQFTVKGNPDHVMMWFVEPFKTSHHWHTLQEEVLPLILSQQIIKSHIGMATAHLKRLEHPNRKCGEKGRAAIEAHGYNTKDACHVIRCLDQCHELLSSGYMEFPSQYREQYVQIRRGDWTLKDARSTAVHRVEQIRSLEGSPKCELRKKPDLKGVDRWLCNNIPGILHEMYGD